MSQLHPESLPATIPGLGLAKGGPGRSTETSPPVVEKKVVLLVLLPVLLLLLLL